MKGQFVKKFIGVDIGGSHITAAEVISGRNSIKPESRFRQHVDSLASAEEILSAWISTIRNLVDGENPEHVKIGIAMPGPFDYEKGISYIKDLNKYESLYGMNIKEILAQELGVPESNILFKNDAEAFLHGEVLCLDIPSDLKVIGVTLGTGLGSAKNINGITTDVFRAIIPFLDGIAEDYISSRWFQKRYLELCGKELENVKALLLDDNEELKSSLFQEFGHYLGKFLNDFVIEEDAQVIIIGGNIAKCLELYIDEVKSSIVSSGVKIYQSVLWEDAALIGAASAWDEFLSEIKAAKMAIK